jgi:nucleotide-binding universal stress UspA family protein
VVDPDESHDVVVVGVDGSEAGQRAARLAGRFAKAEGTHLVVACVVPWSQFSVQTPEENEQRRVTKAAETKDAHERVVDPVVAELTADGVDAEGVVRHGHAAEVLCDLVREHRARHVVVGRRGQSKVRTLLFGSTPGNLIQISPVPVTVVP